MYGVGKTWADALRLLKGGKLKSTQDEKASNEKYKNKDFPAWNDIRLPMANPPPPRDHYLKNVKRFFRKLDDKIINFLTGFWELSACLSLEDNHNFLNANVALSSELVVEHACHLKFAAITVLLCYYNISLAARMWIRVPPRQREFRFRIRF